MLAYAIEHEGRTFTPDGAVALTGAAIEAHNAEIERLELEAWSHKPSTFAAYVTNNPAYVPSRAELDGLHCGGNGPTRILTTWTGKRLGYVLSYRVHRNNFGARIASVRVRGTNGANYYGRMSHDWSQLIRLRRCKSPS